MKRIFVIDWILIVVFIMSAISGFGLHVAGHGGTHEVWHNWAVFRLCQYVIPHSRNISRGNALGMV